MKTYRNLSEAEIKALSAQHCSSSDWSKVEVSHDFSTEYIRHTRFFGRVRLGSFNKEFDLAQADVEKISEIVLRWRESVVALDNLLYEDARKEFSVKEHIKVKADLCDRALERLKSLKS